MFSKFIFCSVPCSIEQKPIWFGFGGFFLDLSKRFCKEHTCFETSLVRRTKSILGVVFLFFPGGHYFLLPLAEYRLQTPVFYSQRYLCSCPLIVSLRDYKALATPELN